MPRLRSLISRLLERFRSTRAADRLLVMQALQLAGMTRRPHLDGLHDAEFCAYSQWGEDGIIDWLISRLPGIAPIFVEFGVDDYREANTRLLLPLRNWRGLVIDGSEENISFIRRDEISWRYDLASRCAFVSAENINALIAQADLPSEIGLLSIDVDGNDYWIWRAISVVRPAIVVCEYNAVFGDCHRLSVPYRADFRRTRAHHSNLYFGASIQALITLGREKGYSFVGTNSNGCNAFFVRDDLAPAVTEALEGRYMFPSHFREALSPDGRLVFTSGHARAETIRDLPLLEVGVDSVVTISELGTIRSPAWDAGRPSRYVESDSDGTA